MRTHYGIYSAEVIDNKDTNRMNRVKVRVKGVMDGVPDSYLPWARYVSATFVNSGSGQAIKPPKGSKVSVMFLDGDINYPVYLGGIVESSRELPEATLDDRYILFRSPNKELVIAFNEAKNDIEILTQKYNTTLGTLIDVILDHAHSVIAVGSPTTAATGVPAKSPVLNPLEFNKGML